MRPSHRTLLAVSLLFNVFAAGLIGGGLVVLARQGEVRPHAAPVRPIGTAGSGLPDPERQRFRHTMQRVFRDGRDLIATARESRQEAASLFVQPRFDVGAVAAALERARLADVAFRTRLETAAIIFAATLPATDRAILAEGLARTGPLRHPRQAGGRPPG